MNKRLFLAGAAALALAGLSGCGPVSGSSDDTAHGSQSKDGRRLIDITSAAEFALIPEGATDIYKLGEDITIPEEWTGPLNFKGELNGNGKTITFNDTVITRGDGNSGGLFSTTGAGAFIHDVIIEGNFSPDSTRGFFGAVAGSAANTRIEACSVTVDLREDHAAEVVFGGVAGWISGGTVIANCYYAGEIFTKYENDSTNLKPRAGGIVGFAIGTTTDAAIEHCYAAGTISLISRSVCAGGICGGLLNDNNSYLTIKDCIALQSNIKAENAESLGRVSGSPATPPYLTLTGNYGKSDMEKNGGPASWTSNAAGLDGESVSDATRNTAAWWEARGFLFGGSSVAAPWKWNDQTSLPVLYFE
ncbi:MAG: hypothetical protein LBD07_02100 [Spirochaetaceae bacterium]|nr:hypothetical protein [Spirochaetaceae bacterium]